MIVYSYLAYTNVCKITTWLEPKTINFKSHSFLLKNLTRMVGPRKIQSCLAKNMYLSRIGPLITTGHLLLSPTYEQWVDYYAQNRV